MDKDIEGENKTKPTEVTDEVFEQLKHLLEGINKLVSSKLGVNNEELIIFDKETDM